jgi:hypothetical protein
VNSILAFVYKIQMNVRLEKYINICFDSYVALKALQTAKRTSPLVWQGQMALSDISNHHSVGLLWDSGQSGVHGSEVAN